ncbi:transcriptional regulator [Actinorhabdospora filicis]|uniref:Transcriptional regulator n=1 Tax=Actinorhabdospora filicis TaxID=1785913 RepID=A0A9W6WDR0_9ACTN|nr:DUF5937 family protein [Actinorhabdospora filicis]GLZ81095.1 transcriptional regulator [Actinorhabdospora filicis]
MLTLTLTSRDLDFVRFAHSPLWEVVASVRVLKLPAAGSPHRPWIEAVAPRLPGLDLRLLNDLVPVPARILPAFLAPPPTSSAPDLDTELATVAATSPERVRIGLDMMEGPRSARLDALYADPVAGLAELVASIRAYWDTALAPYWGRVKSLLESDIRHRARLLAEGGVRRLFADLDPAISWDGERLRIDHKFVERDAEARGMGILLTPSAFVAPSVFSVSSPPWQPTVRYGPRGIGLLWAKENRDVAKALERLLGRSRAQLLSTLDEPAATGELAGRLGLTAGGASQHLTALRDAGLVQGHRSGRYVLYARTELGQRLVEVG